MFLYLSSGFVYGAKKGKILNLFIDDLSIPQPDEFGIQGVNEVSYRVFACKRCITLVVDVFGSLAILPFCWKFSYSQTPATSSCSEMQIQIHPQKARVM